MPMYEYRCAKCNKTTEIIQKFNDPPLGECPECKSNEITKLLSKTSFHLKGTGWYATDYKNSKPAQATKPDAPAAPATEEKKVEAPKPTPTKVEKAD